MLITIEKTRPQIPLLFRALSVVFTFGALLQCLGVFAPTTARAQSRPAASGPAKQPAPNVDGEDFVPLFDGKTLEGWRQANGNATYRVEDGCIVGVCDPKDKVNSFLRTEKTYRDFVLVLEARYDVPGNSGIQFRSQQRDGNGRVYGYQCEMDSNPNRSWSGGIYDEARRGWLNDLKADADAPAREAFRMDDWNTFIIKAHGRRLQTWVNGVPCADYIDNDPEHFTPEGFIALQVHAGKQGTIRWRNIRIKTLGAEDGSRPQRKAEPGRRNAPTTQPKGVSFFLRRLRTLDHLPELEESHTAMASTWDRSGGNLDGWDFKKVEDGRNILLDVDGPGCIHRMFTGWLGEGKDVLGRPGPAGTRIQIFLDRSKEPIFDMPVERFFDDRNGPFPYPLVFHKTYPGILFPVPFAKHCRVQLVNSEAPNWGNFWQITYTTYPDQDQVQSLSWPLKQEEAEELERVRLAWLEAESRQPAVPAKWSEQREFSMDPDAVEEIRLEGCGVVRQMRVGVTLASPEVLRGVRMQICWDGADEPSVDVPLGYFFGNADYRYLNEIHFNSLLLGVTPSETYSCLPMPFSSGAVLRFVNQSDKGVFKMRVLLDVEKRDSLPDNWGRLHATWLEKRAAEPDAPKFGPKKVASHLALERQGPGKYVGVLLHVQWPHEDWWGEGDWMIWTDEDGWPPSYHGTGSEEYFNSGWCSFDRKAVSGYIKTRPGDLALYSFHLNDAFQFRRNIRVAEETMGMDALWMKGETIIHRDHPIWSTTAYWYALPVQPAGSTPEPIQREM